MSYHFLYVEDDEISRTVMEMLIISIGDIQLTTFEDSYDFLERVKKLPNQPNVIFLDIHMKPYSGFEMLAMLREYPPLQDAKVIALTASVMNEEIAELRAHGFDGAIAKPLDREVFPDLVRQILAGQVVWHIV